MPLSEHEQRILEEIERSLRHDDPQFVQHVSRTSLHSHVASRMRLAIVTFFLGLLMLMSFFLSLWVALGGFGVMLLSGLFIYHYMKRITRDQLRTRGRLPAVVSLLARLAGRFRRDPGKAS